MGDFDSEGPNPWTRYTSSNLTSPMTVDGQGRPQGHVSPMNVFSFGFIATALLVSLFLIVAIFEHLFGPSHSFASPEHVLDSSVGNATLEEKSRDSRPVEFANASEVTVMMPGCHHPTYIAQPAPLPSCPREGIQWPHHNHQHEFYFC